MRIHHPSRKEKIIVEAGGKTIKTSGSLLRRLNQNRVTETGYERLEIYGSLSGVKYNLCSSRSALLSQELIGL
jgi:hypothetical protein